METELNNLDSSGYNILHYAILTQQYQQVKNLLLFGLDPNKPTKRGLLPLNLAGNSQSIVLLLLKFNADLLKKSCHNSYVGNDLTELFMDRDSELNLELKKYLENYQAEINLYACYGV